MVTPRWMTERKYANREREVLRVVEVYAAGENKELMKRENKQRKYKKELLFVEESI